MREEDILLLCPPEEATQANATWSRDEPPSQALSVSLNHKILSNAYFMPLAILCGTPDQIVCVCVCVIELPFQRMQFVVKY